MEADYPKELKIGVSLTMSLNVVIHVVCFLRNVVCIIPNAHCFPTIFSLSRMESQQWFILYQQFLAHVILHPEQ